MKKLTFLSLFALFGFIALLYFYAHSESRFALSHLEVLNQFSEAEEADASLEKDVLKSRDFLLPNYDTIVTGGKKLEKSCAAFQARDLGLYHSGSPELDSAVEKFCETVKQKVSRLESFKSKTAILRNSLYYIHKIGTDPESGKQSPVNLLGRKLSRTSLAYYLIPSPSAETLLKSFLDQANKAIGRGLKGEEEELPVILSHAIKIMEGKMEADNLIGEIMAPSVSESLAAVNAAYFRSYQAAARSAAFFRKLLFGCCTIFLSLIIFNIWSLWHAARALTDANAGLEERVRERTRELTLSQETITLQQQALAGSAKMSALGEMAGGIAHEINNPLAAIKAIASQMTDMLGEDLLEKDLLKEMAAKVEKTADRIAKIVQGLRVFSRDGSREVFSPVSAAKLIDDTASFCREKFKNHQTQLMLDPVPEQMQFEARETEISQVLLNLLNNAHDAIIGLPEKWIRVSVAELAESIEIHVTDSGHGIPPEIQKKIFQPFFTTKEIGKGTGLGLSISLGIVSGHHGTLTVDANCPNTRFVLRLPKKNFVEKFAA